MEEHTEDISVDGEATRRDEETGASASIDRTRFDASSFEIHTEDLNRISSLISEPASTDWFGKYRIDDPEKDKLGEGGMGVVYRAYDGGLHRVVALKRMRGFPDDTSRARFEGEMRNAAKLTHPNIVRVYDANIEGGVPFFVMDLINGQPLHTFIKSREPGDRKVLEIMVAVCRAVHYAHQPPFRLIHRDLKPQNVLVTDDGTPHVTDFGLAKAMEKADGDISLTREGFVGTPSYASFEQARQKADVRSDVYSLGATLYHALTGRPPYLGKNSSEVLERLLLREPYTPLKKLRKDIPKSVRIICDTAMAAEPERRYATAGELADDIGRFLRNEPIQAAPAPWWDRIRLQIRRRPIESALIACIMLVGIIAGSFGVKTVFNRKAVALDRSLRQDLLLAQKPGESIQTEQFIILFDRANTIGSYSRDLSDAASRDVAKSMADAIESGIRSPRWDEAAAQNLVVAATVLARYDPVRAKALTAEIVRRADAWNEVASLAPPFANPEKVLTGATFGGKPDGIRVGSPPATATVQTVVPAGRDLQLLLTVGADWERQPTLPAVYLDGSPVEQKGNWIDLRVQIAGGSSAFPAGAPALFADERARGGTVKLRVMSGKNSLGEAVFDTGKLPAGPLHISIMRLDGRISVGLDDLLPLVVSDPNPPARTEAQPLLLLVGGGTEIISFSQRERIRHSADSPLARADEAFTAGHYQDALDAYSSIERYNPSGPFALESEYRQGQCNIRLNHRDRAEQNWREVLSDNDDHWSILATIELMCLIAERDSTQDLQQFDQLSTQLALRDPNLVRELFSQEAYSRLFGILYDNSHRVSGAHTNYDSSWPEHVDRMAAINRLVHGDVDADMEWARLESYEAGYGPEKALPIAMELMSHPNDYIMQTPWQWSCRTYGRLMRYAGRASEGLSVINQHLLDEKGNVRPELQFLLVERARLELALNKTAAAQRDLDQYLKNAPFDRFHVQAYLLLGQLYLNEGNQPAAQSTWHQCVNDFDWALMEKGQVATELAITLSMVAAKCGELDDHRAAGLMACVFSSEGSRADTRFYDMLFPDFMRGQALRAIWADDNPRGQDLIHEFEYADLPYQDRTRLMYAAICYAMIQIQAFDPSLGDAEQGVVLTLVDQLAKDLNSGRLPLKALFAYWTACGGATAGAEVLSRFLKPDINATLFYIQARRAEVQHNEAVSHPLFQRAFDIAPKATLLAALISSHLNHLTGAD